MTDKKELPTMMDVLTELKNLNINVQNSIDIDSLKDEVEITTKHIGSTLIDICDFIVNRECGESSDSYLERSDKT